MLNNYFKSFPNVIAGSSDKTDGNLSFKWSGPDVIKNRKKFFGKFNLELKNLIMPQQVHDDKVVVVSLVQKGKGAFQKDWIKACDGLITNEKGLIIGIETADCLPILFYDPESNYIGTAHAGWKGLVKNKVLVSMAENFKKLDVNLNNVQIEIGPHIQKCCFEVENDVIDYFSEYKEFIVENEDKYNIDLNKIAVQQLEFLGFQKQNINTTNICTCCDEIFYSFRRDKQTCEGGMISFIVVK